MMNLMMAPLNEELEIVKVKQGRGGRQGQGRGLGLGPRDGCQQRCQHCTRSKEERHLVNMGFVPGASVTVVNEARGSLIVRVKDSKVAIDPGVARKIMVRPKH